MSDALFAEILAHPDDDDARLVWADREGGERGELVVIQCALARGGQPREERRRLYQRERELLAKTWPDAEGLVDPRFERGFVTHAAVKVDEMAGVLARYPLVTSIELAEVEKLHSTTRVVFNAYLERLVAAFDELVPGRLARVTAKPSSTWDGQLGLIHDRPQLIVTALTGTPAGRALRGVEFPEGWLRNESLEEFERWPDLEEVRVRVSAPVAQLTSFVEARPRLQCMSVRFYPRHDDDDPTTLFRAFRDFELLGAPSDFSVLARTAPPKLRRLAVGAAGANVLLDLTRSKRLAQIESFAVAHVDDVQLRYITEATFAPSLRELTLTKPERLTTKSAKRLLALPNLDRLDVRDAVDANVFARVAEVVPWVRCKTV